MRRALDRACIEEGRPTCVQAGKLYEQAPPSPAIARRLRAVYDRGCQNEQREACARLAALLEAGRLGASGTHEARTARTRACGLGDGASCRVLAASASPEERVAVARALARGCRGGAAIACEQLAEWNERGRSGAPDLERARTLYAEACRAGRAPSCLRLGLLQQRGLGGESDPAAALLSFTAACERESGEACYLAGRAVELGWGTPADPAAAYDRYRRARSLERARCDAGDHDACARLGRLLREGSGGDADEDGGHELQGRACRAGSAVGCIGWIEQGSEIVRERAAIAAPILARACQGGVGAPCLWVARLDEDAKRSEAALARGCAAGHGGACNAHGMRRFPPHAEGWDDLERACALGDAPGCYHLALALELPGHDEAGARVLSLYRVACSGRFAAACERLGTLLAGGDLAPVDMVGATRAYREGCDLGSAEACFEAGVLRLEGVRVTPDPRGGRQLIERACRNGSARACTRLALQAIRTRGEEGDLAGGLSRLESACSGGHGRACIELGELYRRGREVPADPERARGLFERAAAHSLPPCEQQLELCYARGHEAADPSRFAWLRWQDEPSYVLTAPLACDARLERRCLDASDALTARCETADGHAAADCWRAAALTRRLGGSGLGAGASQAAELEARGFSLAKKGCAAGAAQACEQLAEAYREGRGTAKDERAAERHAARACRLDPKRCAGPR